MRRRVFNFTAPQKKNKKKVIYRHKTPRAPSSLCITAGSGRRKDIWCTFILKMATRKDEGELTSSSSSSSEEEEEKTELKFKNDGSFLEMFKKMQENKQQQQESSDITKPEQASSDASLVQSSSTKSDVKPSESAAPVKKPGLMSIVS